MEENVKSMVGTTVVTHDQTATVTNVVTVSGKMLVYLDKKIKVPTAECERDYVDVNEIERYK